MVVWILSVVVEASACVCVCVCVCVCSVLIEEYTLYDPNIEIICYVDGYKGLLKGVCIPLCSLPYSRSLASLFSCLSIPPPPPLSPSLSLPLPPSFPPSLPLAVCLCPCPCRVHFRLSLSWMNKTVLLVAPPALPHSPPACLVWSSTGEHLKVGANERSLAPVLMKRGGVQSASVACVLV